jgi:membrane associated rhomboid family serine protease
MAGFVQHSSVHLGAMKTFENKHASEPLLNVPPLTLTLTGLIVLAHLARFFLPPEVKDGWLTHFHFVPHAFPAHQPWTIVTYALVHAGWLHCLVNAFSLLAFGAGIEKLKGKIWLCILLLGGIVCGAIVHWLFFPDDLTPLAGVSAGISALLGMLLYLIARDGRALLAAVVAFVLTNALIGLAGVPGQPGLSVAWQAHLGGFTFGLIAGLINSKRIADL